MRLVDLNTQRALEEAQGHIRWLRPDYQAPEEQQPTTQTTAALEEKPAAEKAATTGKQPWPKAIPDQVQTVRALLEKGPQTVDALAESFKRKPTKALSQVLAALDVLGQAKEDDGLWHLV